MPHGIVANYLWGVNECCVPKVDGFTVNYRKSCGSREALQQPDEMQLIKDVFEQCPNNDIPTEFMFARYRRQSGGYHGRPPSIAIIASNHMLSVWKRMFAESVDRHSPYL